jgi:WD40 repeat protein
MACAPEGLRFFTAGEARPPQVRDVTTGREVARLEGAGDIVYSAAFAPGGRSLITGDRDEHAKPGCVRWWDAKTGVLRAFLRGHTFYVVSVAFFPDVRRALSASHSTDRTLRVWDLEKEKEVRRFASTAPCAVSPDGRRVAGVLDLKGTIGVWDLERAEAGPWRELAGHTSAVHQVHFGPRGRTLFSVSDDYRILRHDLESGAVLLHRKLQGNPAAATIAPDGRHIAVANTDGMIFLFRLAPATHARP